MIDRWEMILSILQFTAVKPNGTITTSDARKALVKELKISQEEQNRQMKSGHNKLQNEVRWAFQELKFGGLLVPVEPGVYRISAAGRAIAENPPPLLDYKYLIDNTDYKENLRRAKSGQPIQEVLEGNKSEYREFPPFTITDFSVFMSGNRSKKRLNPTRKMIWEKMKIAQQSIDSELISRDINLHSNVSRYYPYQYNKFKVGGIWVWHSDATSRYFEKPHLSFGIYDSYLFAGLVVNDVALNELEKIANLIEHDPQWLLQIFGNLDSEHRVIWSSGVEIETDLTPGQLSLLSTEMRKEYDWFSIGVAYLPEECPDCCEGLAERIADTYECLIPLYHFVLGSLESDVSPIILDSKEEWEEGDEQDESDVIINLPGGESRRGRPHPRLSRLFRNWIREKHTEKIRKETSGIDVEFKFKGKTVCAELKTESEGSTKYMIRSAIGQLLEYNLYPTRKSANEWLIVLDSQPSKKDKLYIDKLRDFLPKPLHLCWLEKEDFVCYPSWPIEQ